MKKKPSLTNLIRKTKSIKQPRSINIRKLGIVSHDYRRKEQNGYRDFSHTLKKVLMYLDGEDCDSVLFSLFTIVKRNDFKAKSALRGLQNIKTVFIEEFLDGSEREAIRYVVYYKDDGKWQEYGLTQKFGTVAYTKMFAKKVIEPFVAEVNKQRILGNCTVLLCGETNIVKYSKATGNIEDKHGILNEIPNKVKVILNPIHDRMTRFEMKLKRKYLSERNRWVVSAWNKGKEDKNGKVKDGVRPAWTVFHNGSEVLIEKIGSSFIQSQSNIEIGILDITNM